MTTRTAHVRTAHRSAAPEIIGGIVRVGRQVVAERMRGRRRARPGDVPVRRDEVTTEWLTAVLCGGRPGAAVESFVTTPVSNGTSHRWRVVVSYNEAGRLANLPTTLFAKTTASFAQRLTLGLADILLGEPKFFAHIRPAVEIEAPRGYHGAVDARSGRSIALLEDISSTRGAIFCQPSTPISRAQIEDLLSNMATWHGRYWNAPELATHEWLKLPRQHFANLDRLVGMRTRSRVGMQRARAVLPTALDGQHPVLYSALECSLDLACEGPLTFLHGDSHIGNTYATADGRMGFTDWQVVLRGTWAYDFAYTVTSGLTVENRRAWERELLEFYLSRLAAAGGAAPDFESAWLAYRQQCLYPLFIWLTTIGRSPIQPKYQPDEVCLGIIERTATAVVDLDAVAAVGR